ncbi:MAG TPA: HTTM domain-containing protein [Chthoniobacterales bacterium]|nr:HTTM domain-containing protein [Chthoniobacterales bacterium]
MTTAIAQAPTPRAARTSLVARLATVLFAPVDIAALIFFRIAFGMLMTWEVCRYFAYGWIGRYWIEPQFLFKYYGFSWVHPWPGNGMYIHWALLGVLAVFITTGFLYRFAVPLFFLLFTHSFLLDQALYLNHLYLVCLLALLLSFMPANRAFSIDAWLWPRIRSQVTPAWTLWMLRFQIGVVYFYGGVAKISPDWLRGEPMRAWLARRTDFPLIGQFFRQEWAAYFFSYGGLLLDLLIVPFLLWKRTRIAALIVAILFHIMNARMFQIGIFPWLGIAATAMFFPPDWPRRVLGWLRRSEGRASARPHLVVGMRRGSRRAEARPSETKTIESRLPKYWPAALALLAGYLAVQVLLPLRHLLYPGRADWTYEGHRFSWRMKLHDRDASARFYVIDENGYRESEVSPRAFLRRLQASKMAARPDMILQFAHYLRDKLPRSGPKPLRVEARVLASLNGRKSQLLVDRNVNLAAEPRTLRHMPWILPLTEPLPDGRTERKTREPEPTDTDEQSAD